MTGSAERLQWAQVLEALLRKGKLEQKTPDVKALAAANDPCITFKTKKNISGDDEFELDADGNKIVTGSPSIELVLAGPAATACGLKRVAVLGATRAEALDKMVDECCASGMLPTAPVGDEEDEE